MVPSGRGAPGAFGSASGSNASDFLGLARRGRLAGALGGFGDVRRRRGALGAVAEPEFDVLAEFLQLSLEPMLGVLQFLDPAVGLPKLLLELVDAQHQLGRSRSGSPGMSAGGAAWRWKGSNWA